jgi:hypothetical protein
MRRHRKTKVSPASTYGPAVFKGTGGQCGGKEEMDIASHTRATNRLMSWLIFDTENGYPPDNFHHKKSSLEIVVL